MRKVLASIVERINHLGRTIRRFWNWRKKTPKTRFGVSVWISQRHFIHHLPSVTQIERAHIDIPLIGISLRERHIKGKIFIDCIFSQQAMGDYTFTDCSFVGCSFNGANFVSVEFHGCKFSDCWFYKTKFKSVYLDPRTIYFNDEWHWDRANVNTTLFQALYKNSKEMHQEEFAMYADIKFQFYQRYEYLRGKKPDLKKFARNLIYDYLLGFGYGVKNTLFVTALIIFLFAFLVNGNLKDGRDFWEALYFSVVSFTTTGYGEITPNHKFLPLFITSVFLLISVGWCAVVTAIIVKRIVK